MRITDSLAGSADIMQSLQRAVLRSLRLHLMDIAPGQAALQTSCPELDSQTCFKAMALVALKSGLCKQVQRCLQSACLKAAQDVCGACMLNVCWLHHDLSACIVCSGSMQSQLTWHQLIPLHHD